MSFTSVITPLFLLLIGLGLAFLIQRRPKIFPTHDAILNSMEDGVIVVNLAGEILFANPTAQRLTRASEVQLTGNPIDRFLPLTKIFPDYENTICREVSLPSGGELCFFSVCISPLRQNNGQKDGYVLVLRDITAGKQAELNLLASESNLAEAQRVFHLGSWEWDVNTSRITCSDEMFRIAGLLPIEGDVPLDVFSQFLPKDAAVLIRSIQQNKSTKSMDLEHEILRPSGEARQVHTRILAYRDEHGMPLRLLGSVQDITERKQAEAQIRLQATALESAANSIMIANAEGRLLWANPAFVQMTGQSLQELQANFFSLFDYGSPEMETAIRNRKAWQGEVVNIRPNGANYIADTTITPVLAPDGSVAHFVLIAQDITEKIEAKKQLEYLATHDPLTGLPNRLLFKDRLSHALTIAKRTGQQGAIFFIDLDDFKAVNDVYSHTMGDDLLILLAKRIQGCLRESDTVARIGGDEFAVLLEDTDQVSVEIVAQKVIESVGAPATFNEETLLVTASIGICFFPQDGGTISTLMKNADLAMYQAKARKKNTFEFFNQNMAGQIKEQIDLMAYLRLALKNNLFQIHYQPQVDSETGKIIGAEALLRLPHPVRGWIPPSEFIPLAEKTDLILLIDEWMINAACRKKRELLDSGLPEFNLSINISNRQLGQANLVEFLKKALSANHLNPAFIELEISESSAFYNVDVTLQTLSELKEMGIRLAIDDFGKGYSSLNYLANFTLDVLKIDLSFAQRIPYSHNDVGIVKGIIAIAKSLGIAVIVEGVENEEQLNFFMSHGCRLVQGNYYSPAIAVDQLEKLLHHGF